MHMTGHIIAAVPALAILPALISAAVYASKSIKVKPAEPEPVQDAEWAPVPKKPRAGLFIGPDCGSCPCAWEDVSYESECSDCGCLFHKNGDMPERSLLCSLPDFVKRLWKRHCDRKRDEAMARDCEGMAEWFAEEEKKNGAMLEALKAAFPSLEGQLGQQSAERLRIEYEAALERRR